MVPAVSNRGDRALPTVLALSEEQTASGESGEVARETSRKMDGKAQEHDRGMRGEEWVLQLTDSASAAHRESGVVDG